MNRPGYTLVELLVTVTIIAILASFLFGAVYAAQQAANTARTKALVAKLHEQIMLRWESYRTRRVPVNTAGMNPQQAALRRLLALRELMRLELPDRPLDVMENVANPSQTLTTSFIPQPAISRAYQRRVMNTPTWSPQFFSAECLYMIVTMGLEDDSQGAEQFSTSDVGDLDGDGLPEFHDAWGQPIRFLRWAPGFVSDLQPVKPGNPPAHDPVGNHDPFDPLKLDMPAIVRSVSKPGYSRGYALVPLVYSAGPDGKTDINVEQSLNYGQTSRMMQYTITNPPMNNDPYVIPGGGLLVGEFLDENSDGDNSLDNIHNHLITSR